MDEDKSKILYLMKIFLEETDEDHILNAAELCQELQRRFEIHCTRKTVYANIARLEEFGLKIEQVKGNRQGYYVKEREFALPELKLLVDVVESSKFITKSKSETLIHKLETLTSNGNARQLQRNVFIYNRTKSENESIFANIDIIHRAMNENQRIRFQYCEWTIKKELVPKKNGEFYEVSPWSLTWCDGNYYLISYMESAADVRHFRVDKMRQPKLVGMARSGQKEFEDFDLPSYARKTFYMYRGTTMNVELRCENSLVGVILDRFGTNVIVKPDGSSHFLVNVEVSVSPPFYGWLAGLGSGVQVVGPEGAKYQYKKYIEEILQAVNQNEG